MCDNTSYEVKVDCDESADDEIDWLIVVDNDSDWIVDDHRMTSGPCNITVDVGEFDTITSLKAVSN